MEYCYLCGKLGRGYWGEFGCWWECSFYFTKGECIYPFWENLLLKFVEYF